MSSPNGLSDLCLYFYFPSQDSSPPIGGGKEERREGEYHRLVSSGERGQLATFLDLDLYLKEK